MGEDTQTTGWERQKEKMSTVAALFNSFPPPPLRLDSPGTSNGGEEEDKEEIP
jgi:hypothetical protein